MKEISFALRASGRRSPKLHLPVLRKLFCSLGLFRALHECISEIVYIFIHDESGDRIIQCLLKRCRSGFAMLKARKQLVIGKRVHRPLVVSVKLRLVHVGTGWNRAFQRVEGLLRFLAADALQPGDRRLFVGSPFRKSKAISDDDERSIGTGMADPAEIFLLLLVSFSEFTVSPVTHGAERDFAFNQSANSL